MRSARLLWTTVGIAALLSTVLLAGGWIYAVQDMLHPAANQASDLAPNEPNDAQKGTTADGYLDLVALGDSLTKGTGDRTGAGYINRLKDKLTKAGDQVRLLNNIAVNGYRTDQLLADLDKRSVVDTVSRADVIVFTIGGNDLFKFVREEIDILDANIQAVDLFKSIPEPIARFAQILDRLHTINPSATIVYIGLYNPFLDLDPTRETSQAIGEWNAQAAKAIHAIPNALMVPTADLFERDLAKYLSTDHFHPNEQGYERIAVRAAQVLE